MQVSDLMTRDVVACRPTDCIEDAARMMWELGCGCLPVVADEGQVLGLVTDRDICMAALFHGKGLAEIPVYDAMQSALVTCRPQDCIAEAELRMARGCLRGIPVVDESDCLVGVLSLADVARYEIQRGQVEVVEADLAAFEEPVIVEDARASARADDRGGMR
jgi:CBS domain-containing protein